MLFQAATADAVAVTIAGWLVGWLSFFVRPFHGNMFNSIFGLEHRCSKFMYIGYSYLITRIFLDLQFDDILIVGFEPFRLQNQHQHQQ